MLRNVVFYLKRTFKVWFGNDDATINSYTFKGKIRAIFGKFVNCQLAAKTSFSTRAERATESLFMYIQNVLALCHNVDSQKPETEKISNVLKGLVEDAFNCVLFKISSRVDIIITERYRFTRIKVRRIAYPFTRLPNPAAASSHGDLSPQLAHFASPLWYQRHKI